MNYSTNATQLIKTYEGLVTTAYECPGGVWTIGYGHTDGVKEGDTTTESGACLLLKQDMNKVQTELNTLFDRDGVKATQNQFDALMSFTYNLGINNLRSSTLYAEFCEGNIDAAAAQFDRWVYAKGKILKGLVKRRAAEKKLFLAS